MSLYLLDTDTLSLLQQAHPKVTHAVATHPTGLVRIPAVAAKEQIDGRAAALHQAKDPRRLAEAWNHYADAVMFLSRFPIVPMSEAAIQRYSLLMKLKLGIGGNDVRIAAIALEVGATVVTRNTRDFSRVPGLLIVDWSV